VASVVQERSLDSLLAASFQAKRKLRQLQEGARMGAGGMLNVVFLLLGS